MLLLLPLEKLASRERRPPQRSPQPTPSVHRRGLAGSAHRLAAVGQRSALLGRSGDRRQGLRCWNRPSSAVQLPEPRQPRDDAFRRAIVPTRPELATPLATRASRAESEPRYAMPRRQSPVAGRPRPSARGDGESPEPHLGLRAVARAEPLRLLELTESPG